MKKLILLIGLVTLLFTSCGPDIPTVYGRRGFVVVTEKGAVVIEKTGYEGLYGDVPKFVMLVEGDTLVWLSVPLKTYNKFNQGDTIKPL
jgi:hypothetical protein